MELAQERDGMESFRVFIETGSKKTFAGALDYPGWCRSSKDEVSALQALLDYAGRYARVLHLAQLAFKPPSTRDDFVVIERCAGNTTTDFGAPDSRLETDLMPLEEDEYQRQRAILLACWDTFRDAVQNAQGKTLRKGPRGGGRELAQIVSHVLEAERAYLNKLGWQRKVEGESTTDEAFTTIRQSVLEAIEARRKGELPDVGRRGGVMWTLRFYTRRSAWHLLDHAWEIEDRSV